jgi:hypothetical protein
MGFVGQEIWQQCVCHPLCFRRRIPPRVFQRVRENGQRTGHRPRVRRRGTQLSRRTVSKGACEGRAPRSTWIQGPVPTARGGQRPSPQANLLLSEGGVRQFKHDTADILSAKKSWPVNCRLFSAPSTSQKKNRCATLRRSGSRLSSVTRASRPVETRRPVDDNLAAITGPGACAPLNAAESRV